MRVRLVGTDLPGRRFDDAARSGCAYDDVTVGVQRGREVEQLVPGDADGAVFELEVRPVDVGEGRGPYVHGRRGDRFLYLVWVAGPDRAMFRRAKLKLAGIPASTWTAASAPGHRLEGWLPLRDRAGEPRCATVPPDVIDWRAVPEEG